MGFSVNRRNSLRSPACAGKSLPEYRHVFRAGDHPRVCGEKSGLAAFVSSAGGSPPRVRGKVSPPHGIDAEMGITPACAGKSGCCRMAPEMYRDHPRVCGEKPLYLSSSTSFAGSPPRVRGKARVISSSFIAARDHPRVCGEKDSSGQPPRYTQGSPPRVRGKAASVVQCSLSPRITPACAGTRP